MSQLLADKTAVVTGGASGNGRQISLEFAQFGANTVVADIESEPRREGKPTHEKINDELDDVEATYVETDVTNKEDIAAAIEATEEFGGLDIMVNNAGVFRDEKFTEVTEDEFDWLMDINVKGVFFGSQLATEQMREQGRGGSIINLSSVAGLEGSAENVTYCTSKGAVRLMTYSVAGAVGGDDIRVNAIHPGLIDTNMMTDDVPVIGSAGEEEARAAIPLGRFGQPEDVADAAVILASDLTSFVTGSSFVVDGGQTNSTPASM